MYREPRHDKLHRRLGRGIGPAYGVCLVNAVALAAAFGLSDGPSPGSPRPSPPFTTASVQRADPSRYILNALLVPALDSDAVPLRWVDPRPILRCGPHTQVRVNGEPLVAGALVPDLPFEFEWHADECRYFGAYQARVNGAVTLTVFREDWGFSAIVQPAHLRVTSALSQDTFNALGAAWLPQCVDSTEPDMLSLLDDGRSLSCR